MNKIKCVFGDEVVIPGTVIEDLGDIKPFSNTFLGPGLTRSPQGTVIANHCGILKANITSYWIDTCSKRYIPKRGDYVIGTIKRKMGDYYAVDIGSSEEAVIHFLAFEGATKLKRPEIQRGDSIYAVVIISDPQQQPELACIDHNGKEGKMGLLMSDGLIFKCSLNLVRKILNPKCCILELLGETIKYEIAVGLNGKVWVNAVNVRSTIAISNAILASENLTNNEIEKNCLNIFKTVLH
uniref:Ribosomal RNA-processing protein 40 n=1 Tax=Clastoptera arizonana TaxID=38151 RepID=A0A1B6DDQ9_9HEMI